MARELQTLDLELRFAWWVTPYIRLAALALWATGTICAMDEDDERLFAQNISEFVVKYGARYYCNGVRLP